jgi:hypothetical protein
MATITTPRPPLNLFNVSRINVQSFFTDILEVPDFLIPVNGPNPARTVQAVALLTSLTLSNNSEDTIQVSVRITDAENRTWVILNEMDVPPNDFAVIDFAKQNLPSGERLEVRTNDFQGAVAVLSYVLNQREEFVVIT